MEWETSNNYRHWFSDEDSYVISSVNLVKGHVQVKVHRLLIYTFGLKTIRPTESPRFSPTHHLSVLSSTRATLCWVVHPIYDMTFVPQLLNVYLSK